MKTTPRILWLAAVILALGWVAWNHLQTRNLHRELTELRRAVLAAPSTPTERSTTEADPNLTAELVALRGELVALRRELQNREPRAPAALDSSETATARKPVLPPYIRHGWIDPAGLPQPVLEIFRQQLGDTPIEGAHVKQSEGRLFYSIETRLADGRGLELAVDAEGQVRHRVLETSLDSLEPRLQQAVAGALGDTPVRRVAEVYEDGQTRYRVQTKTPEQAVNLLLSPDGTVLKTEILRRETAP